MYIYRTSLGEIFDLSFQDGSLTHVKKGIIGLKLYRRKYSACFKEKAMLNNFVCNSAFACIFDSQELLWRIWMTSFKLFIEEIIYRRK